MNTHPYAVDANMMIKEVYAEIFVMQKGINVVPVLENGKLIGAIDLRIGI